MAFSESIKINVRRKAHFACCLCKALGVEIHHIVPQDEGGPDTEDNAAPLCPSCHETYGANPQKRKFIKEARDLWYEICTQRYASDSQQLEYMQRMLENINSFVRTSNDPILPLAMFYTLRHTTTEDAIERAFGDSKGFKSINNKLLQLVSTVRLGGTGLYNAINYEPKESNCTLSKDQLAAYIEKQGYVGESAIKSPLRTTLKFFFEDSNDSPSLTLKKAFDGSGLPHEVKHLQLFDSTIFQDSFVHKWEVSNASRSAWNINHLQGSRIRLSFDILSFNAINFQSTPKLHNLHLYFGDSAPHILYFKEDQLANPVISEESNNGLIKWDLSAIGLDSRPLRVSYEFIVDDELFFNQRRQFS